MGVDRWELRAVTCPANTPQSTPAVADCSFTPGRLLKVGIVIPYGHAYLTGLAIEQAGQIVIPYTGDSWIVGDNETLWLDVADQLASGQWSVSAWNGDEANDHSWYLRFAVQENRPAAPPATAAPITPAAIAAAASAGPGGGSGG